MCKVLFTSFHCLWNKQIKKSIFCTAYARVPVQRITYILEYQMSVPSSELGLPNSVEGRGGDTRMRVRGSQFGRLKKEPSTLSTLWPVPSSVAPPPFRSNGRDTLAYRGGGGMRGPNSDEGTNSLVRYVYYNPSKTIFCSNTKENIFHA